MTAGGAAMCVEEEERESMKNTHTRLTYETLDMTAFKSYDRARP